MIRHSQKERRRYPRIEQALPIKIVANGYDFATSTQNVSCIGAYCHLDKYIPPFTKIAVKVTLPLTTGNRIGNVDVECNGVIVRTEDDKSGGFNVAIFFNGIKDNQRKKISQYINQFLPPQDSSRLKRL
jgi:hypothetical protein